MMPKKAFFLSACFLLPFRLVLSQVVISEVMYDPSGSENSDEFVELINVSPGDTIDLMGWRLGDGTGDDALEDAGNGLKLGPNQYAVILDPDYFGQSASYDALIPDEALIMTLEGNTLGSGGLSNTKSETVIIFDPEGKAVDQYAYHTGNKPGYSDERINLNISGSLENWADSKVLNGTPGRRNGAAKVPYDLNLVNLFLEKSQAGGFLNAVVLNDGTMTVSGFGIFFYDDVNLDSVLEEKETIGNISSGQSLAPGDSTVISINLDLRPGIHSIAAWVFFKDDEKPENNIRYSPVILEFPENSLIINEIMYNPTSADGEWIELLNIQSTDIDLAGWSISDSDSQKRIQLRLSSCNVPAGEYFLIAGDSSLLKLNPGLSGKIQVVHSFPGLNNDSDSVILYDPSGKRIDRVEYFDVRGGEKGISLERINPHQVTSDRENWMLCTSPDGATPGEFNSCTAVSRIPEGSIEIIPNPFSPDGDGWEETTSISFNFSFEKAYVYLRIYDIRGRIIKHIERGGRTGKTGWFIWDGRDDLDKPVSIGQYVVFFEASEQDGDGIFQCRSVLVLARRL